MEEKNCQKCSMCLKKHEHIAEGITVTKYHCKLHHDISKGVCGRYLPWSYIL